MSGATGDMTGATGDMSGATGDMTGATGDMTGATGDMSGATGDMSGATGDMSGATGDMSGATGDMSGATGDMSGATPVMEVPPMMMTLVTMPITQAPQLVRVSDSAALTYLVNNPDVMVHAKNVVKVSRVSPGRDFQKAMEQVAIKHYNDFGANEGRHYDLSRSLNLKALQTSAKVSPSNSVRGLTESPALNYLFNNLDVMRHAQASVRASGIKPGNAFQQALERAAVTHYNTFGAKEGRAGLGQ
jgi:hypothetical protein